MGIAYETIKLCLGKPNEMRACHKFPKLRHKIRREEKLSLLYIQKAYTYKTFMRIKTQGNTKGRSYLFKLLFLLKVL